jgi:hypothetical protein
MTDRMRLPLVGVPSSTDDDWAPPKVNSRYSQPQTYQSRTRTGSNPTTNRFQPQINEPPSSPESKSSKPVATAKPGSNALKSTEISPTPSKTPSSSLAPAETDSAEIDIESAVAALPPNMQETARRQLAAIQAKVVAADTNQSSEPARKSPASERISMRLSDSANDESSSLESFKAGEAGDLTSSKTALKSISHGPSESLDSKSKLITASAEKEKESSDAVVQAASFVEKTTKPPASWNASLNESVQALEKELQASEGGDENLRLSKQLTLRWLYVAQRRLNDAMRPIEGLDPIEQDYVRHQVQALYEASNPDAMPVRSRRWSLVMNSQREATNKLAAVSNLEVRSTALCSDVQGYGVVTKFPTYKFQADQEVLLYCELENVQAEPVKEGFETQLQGTYEILDESGRRITDQLLPMEKEICKNHRRDYFIIYHIYMPTKVEPGKYQMRVTIEDMKARKFGQSHLEFQITP